MKVRLAEWILSLVLTPERAASTLGDWIEDAPERGAAWFWSCVFRTVAARVWYDLAKAPEGMARLGLMGFALNTVVPLIFFVLVSFMRHGDIRYNHEWLWTKVMIHTAKNSAVPARFEIRWPILLGANLLWDWSVFQTGRWIARHTPGRELAGCVAVALAGWMCIVVTEVLSSRSAGIFTISPLVFPMGMVHDIVLFSAAVWTRRRVAHMG